MATQQARRGQRKPQRKEPVPFLDVRNSVILFGNVVRRVAVRARTFEPREVGTVYRGGVPANRSTFQRAYAGDIIVKTELAAGARRVERSFSRVEADPSDPKKLVEVPASESVVAGWEAYAKPELVEWLETPDPNPNANEGLLPIGCGWDGVNTIAGRMLIEKIRKFFAGAPAELLMTFEAAAPASTALAKALRWEPKPGEEIPRLLPAIRGLATLTDKLKPFDVIFYYDNANKVTVVYPEAEIDPVPKNAMRAAVVRVNARKYRGYWDGLSVRLFARRRDISKIKNP